MGDRLDSLVFKDTRHRRLVANIHVIKGRARWHIAAMAGMQAIHNHHLMTGRQQLIGNMATNKPRTARD